MLEWGILFIRKVSGMNNEKYPYYSYCWIQQKVRKKIQHLIALSLFWLKHVHFAPKCHLSRFGWWWMALTIWYDEVIKWKHFPRCLPFVRGIHRPSMNSPHKGQWRRALVFSLICYWIHGWVNNGEAGDLRRHCAHWGITVITHVFLIYFTTFY